MIWIQEFAELNGVTQPVNGSWIQAICEAEGITEPVNGTWIEALARNKGATEPYNGSWWAALAVALGITQTSNGTWIQALAENGTFFTFDSDAEAFFTTLGITDETQKSAIDSMVKDMKSYSIWNKFYAIYPFVGGTSVRHSYNLKNTAQYQITWTVDPTHSANGVTFNGTTQYGRTGLIPSTALTLNNTALHVYNRRTPLNTTGVALGAVVSSSQQFRLQPRSTSNEVVSLMYNGTAGQGVLISSVPPDNTGLMSASRTASNSHVIYKKGTSIGSNATSGGTLPNNEFFLGSQNNAGSPTQFYSGTMQFAAISEGLTAAECGYLETIVENFQRDLSRPANGGNRITYEGNSFIATYGLRTGITNALTAANADSNTASYAVGAASISNIIGSSNYMLDSARVAAVDARYSATAYRNVIVVFEGINELYYQLGTYSESQSVTNTIQAFQDYVTLQRPKGFKLIINTLTPRNNVGTPVNYESARLSVNTALRSIFDITTSTTRVFKSSNPTWSDVILCDVGDSPLYGQTGDENDATYYLADLVHPTATTVSDMSTNYYSPAIQMI